MTTETHTAHTTVTSSIVVDAPAAVEGNHGWPLYLRRYADLITTEGR
jgi:hypothetical protein